MQPILFATLAVWASTFALSGCVQAEFTVLKNPATGQVVECRSESCARGFEASGFQRMN
jgi:hypothetical protein